MKLYLQAALLLIGANLFAFELKDTPGKHLDILDNGKKVARYMYEFDKSSKEKLDETYKPYLHVYAADGETLITKGSGGNFTHHRGIFIGWNRMGFNGKRYDRWHMNNGQIVHQSFAKTNAFKDSATFTSITHWNDETGLPMVIEQRTMTFRKAPSPARLQIDFETKLTAANGDVMLDGDPEHAGIQYRPANEVDAKLTKYYFPKEDADPHKDRDYPWVGLTYSLADKKYTVIHLNHATNPTNTIYSAYRDYGRFGAFFIQNIPKGESLNLKYRFIIKEGELENKEWIEKAAATFSKKK